MGDGLPGELQASSKGGTMASEATGVERGVQPRLFARKASGLVREFGFFDSFVFNVIGYALGLVLAITPFFGGALFPDANMFLILTFGVVLSLFNGLTYGLLGGAMPRSGGDYVYNGRVLHPAIGFMANWGFTWSQFLGIGIYTQWTINYALAVSAATIGYSTGSQGLIDFSTFISRPGPSFVFSLIVLAIVVLVQLGGMRFLRRFLNLFFFIAVIGTLVTLFVFLSATRDQFVSAFNQFMSANADLENAYSAVVSQAREAGFTQPATTVGGALLALPLGYWVFIGFTYSAYIGGEVKEPQKVQSRAILASLFFGYLLYMVVLAAYYNIVGTEFNNAAAHLEYNDASPLPVAGVLNFFAGLLTSNVVLNVLMGLSFFLWHFLLLFVMFTICVRNMFAWSFDQIMPTWLTRVTSTTRAPWSATLAVALIAAILLWASIFTPLFDYIFNYIAIFSIAFWITSFAAILLPYRKRELFESSPPNIQARIGGVPLVTIAGVVNLILFTVILYSSFTLPAFSGPVGPASLAFLFGIYLVGLAIYYVAAGVRRREGTDFNLLFTEIPPE
jgi:basic amino acid/polyamine antiporter, APA family